MPKIELLLGIVAWEACFVQDIVVVVVVVAETGIVDWVEVAYQLAADSYLVQALDLSLAVIR